VRRLLLFIGLVAALLGTGAIATWRVDPFSQFYDPAVIAAAEDSPRPCLISNGVVGPNGWLPFKFDLFRRRVARTVVLGSSRVLKIASHPGERDFVNLGIPGTGIDTVKGIFERLRAQHHGRLTVYLGVELFWFNHTYSSTVPLRVSFLDDLRYLLDRQNVQTSLRVLRARPGRLIHRWHISHVGGRCVVDLPDSPVRSGNVDAWEVDGSFQYRFELVSTAPPAAGEYVQDLVTFQSPYYRDWNGLDRKRIETLADALAFARRVGWNVVGFAPPYSRRYRTRLVTAPQTAPEWSAFGKAIIPLFGRYGFSFLDLRDVASIPCANTDFVDEGVHPNATCAERLRRRLDAAALRR
jgi:hypothetical protein